MMPKLIIWKNRHLLNVSDLHKILARYGMAGDMKIAQCMRAAPLLVALKPMELWLKGISKTCLPRREKDDPVYRSMCVGTSLLKCLLALLRMRVIQSQTPSQNLVYVCLMMQLARYHHLVRSTVT